MKSKLLSLLLVLGMLLSLAACSSGAGDAQPSDSGASVPSDTQPSDTQTSDSAGTEGETVIFTDSLGREVELPAQITRIAPSGPLAQIVLFALCPDYFVGVSSEWDIAAEDFLPTEYYSLPVVGQLYGKGEVNLENLALADPQVIIDVGQPKDTAVEDLDALQEQLGIPCVHITADTKTTGDAYRMLGQMLGLEEQAEAIATYCEDTYAEMEALMERVGEENKVSLLYCPGADGMNVIAKGSYHSEIIDLLANNVAEVAEPSSKGTGDAVNMEQLLLWDPDVIIFAPDADVDAIAADPSWQQMKAIQNGTYYQTPQGPYNWMGFPPSVNRYLGMLWMASLLYPDQVDYDLYERVNEYYQMFYHCELTQEQFEGLTAQS